MQIFARYGNAKPGTENTRGLNLRAMKLMTSNDWAVVTIEALYEFMYVHIIQVFTNLYTIIDMKLYNQVQTGRRTNLSFSERSRPAATDTASVETTETVLS